MLSDEKNVLFKSSLHPGLHGSSRKSHLRIVRMKSLGKYSNNGGSSPLDQPVKIPLGNRGEPTNDVGSIISHQASNSTPAVAVDDPSFQVAELIDFEEIFLDAHHLVEKLDLKLSWRRGIWRLRQFLNVFEGKQSVQRNNGLIEGSNVSPAKCERPRLRIGTDFSDDDDGVLRQWIGVKVISERM
jgi:hypothetical protein